MTSLRRSLSPFLFVSSVAFALATTGCGKTQALGEPGASASAKGAEPAQVYRTRGVIKAFGEGRKSVKIAHEDIPGFMKAMTMPFAVKSPSVLDGLNEADAVEFSFSEAPAGGAQIETIKKR